MGKPRVPYTKTDAARASYDAKRDLYYRREGEYVKDGRLVPRCFWLGNDEVSARDRAYRIHLLWEECVAMGHETWPPDALALADRIRRGEFSLAWTENAVRECGNSGRWLGDPAHRPKLPVYPSIRSLPTGKPNKTGKGLYAAIDRCCEWVKANWLDKSEASQGQTSEYGMNLVSMLGRLKTSMPDMAINELDYNAIADCARYWRSRPKANTAEGRKTGKRIAVTTVKNMLTTLRLFLSWLRKQKEYGWRKPEDIADELGFRESQVVFNEEIQDLANGVAVYSDDELKTIWKYATPWERVFLVLALNCGYSQAEIRTLRVNELHFKDAPPRIKRIRLKKRVYGEWALWPETMAALKMLIPLGDNGYAVTVNGHQVPRQRITNNWSALIRRIRKDVPDFRQLPFKFLRKTSAQLVREVSDGETAGVHLCHGTPVRTDSQLGAYSNPVFARVYKAHDDVRARLAAVFDAVPEPFAGGKLGGGGNLSVATIERIRKMLSDGYSASEVAKIVGVSRQTVYRNRRDLPPAGLAET